jgi:flagellar M-ring protein FliF
VGENIGKMKKQLNEFWEGMDKNKRTKFLVSSLLIIVGIIILVAVLTRPKYEVLYENLSLKDMGQITKQLDDMNVKWKTDEQGNSILVPADMKNKIKLDLASQGLPKEGYGFYDAFNDSNWKMTDYEKKERMKVALQDELSSTIAEIDGIESATVYIKEQEDTGFVIEDDKKETTASVFIKKSDNRPLSSDKVYAIKNLVAGSINMEADNVALIDDSGKLLDDEKGTESFDMTDQYSIKQSIETRIDESLRNFLENVFGYGNVDVRSSVGINFDSETTKIVEFSPPIEGSEEGLIRSMEEVEEHTVGESASGVPGTESNPPEYVNEEEQGARYDKVSRAINNELNEINREINKSPGQVESITVAVLVNSDALVDGELTEDRKEEIANLVSAATGLNTEQVEVSSQQFSKSIPDDEEDKVSKMGMLQWILIGSLVAAGVIGFVVYRRRKEEEMEPFDQTLYEDIVEEPEIEELEYKTEESEMKKQVENFVDKKPDAVAQLLRTWLNE